MATITQQPRPVNVAETQRKVRDPLHKLRGLIRRYVITEVVTTLIICLAAWFWIGLLLDYGLFKATSGLDSQFRAFDWVQSTPRWLRGLFLGSAILVVCLCVELIKLARAMTSKDEVNQRGVPRWVVQIFRTPWLLAAVVTPILLLYYAGWILLSLGRTNDVISGGMMQLVVFGLLLGFLGLVMINRFFYEFRDVSLALLLERRFPRELGDRLITAVELADVKEAARLGYSADMVEQTIRDAAQRVGQLPVSAVFKWNRLYVRGGVALGLTLGLYLLAGVSWNLFSDKSEDFAGFSEFHDVAAIWYERNIRLDDERWPRRVMLEVLGFDRDRTQKIGKGQVPAEPPRVRALEYVVADKRVPEGWRALCWNDLTSELLGSGLEIPPSTELPLAWERHPHGHGVPVDVVKLNLEKMAKMPAQRMPIVPGQGTSSAVWSSVNVSLAALHADLMKKRAIAEKIRPVLKRIDDLVARSSFSRKLRKLQIPDKVQVTYRGNNTEQTLDLERMADNIFTQSDANQLKQVEEDLRVNFIAEDYYSDDYKILAVEVVDVAELTSFEEVPAYFYHMAHGKKGNNDGARNWNDLRSENEKEEAQARARRAWDAADRELAGLRQKTPERKINLVTGNNVDVPLGANVTLRVRCNKPLNSRRVKVEIRGTGVLDVVEPRNFSDDQTTFDITFNDVRAKVEFDLDFVDADGVRGIRRISLSPGEDQPPRLETVAPQIVRMVEDRYWVTPQAIIPFLLTASDDRGLANVEYFYSLEEVAAEDLATRQGQAVSAISLAFGGGDNGWNSLTSRLLFKLTTGERNRNVIENSLTIPDFLERLRVQRQVQEQFPTPPQGKSAPIPRPITLEAIKDFLKTPVLPTNRLMNRYAISERNLDRYLEDRKIDTLAPFDFPLKGFDIREIRDPATGARMQLQARSVFDQKRYRLDIQVRAEDTNVERIDPATGMPARGRVVSRLYNFLIVSEDDLLEKISDAEQGLYDKLLKTQGDLLKGRASITQLFFDLPQDIQPNQGKIWDSLSVRAEAVQQVLTQAGKDVKVVYDDYEKIAREMRTNRVSKRDRMEKVDRKVLEPLDRVLHDTQKKGRDGAFPLAQDALTKFRRLVDGQESTASPQDRLARTKKAGEEAMKEVDELIGSLQRILNEMEGITSDNYVMKLLQDIARKQAEAATRLKRFYDALEEKKLRELLEGKP